ncbi:MAG: hypothetical protein HXX09_04225 [Bacteroidetes bacterium]|nr:hypothetical protein [Bacteroidota bacterium]
MEELKTTQDQPLTTKVAKNAVGTFALIIGITGLVLSFIPIINLFAILLDITAIILGAIGSGKAKKIGKGKAGSLIGLIFGIVGVVVTFLVLFMFSSQLKYGHF